MPTDMHPRPDRPRPDHIRRAPPRAGRLLPGLALLLAAGCQTAPSHELAAGSKAYDRFPAPVPGQPPQSYLIGPLDVINVSVFQEPDLSVQGAQVDAGGDVLLPLVGEIKAAGFSATDFAGQLRHRLGERYLENPQISVVVTSAASQRVTVDGSVTKPGVYEIRGRTTLIDALAMAEGPTRVARLKEVVVFRNIKGQRNGAVFDVPAIRSGRSPDPEILGNDTVVVGLSNVKAAWRDFLSTVPLIAIFRPFY